MICKGKKQVKKALKVRDDVCNSQTIRHGLFRMQRGWPDDVNGMRGWERVCAGGTVAHFQGFGRAYFPFALSTPDIRVL